jgi:glycosyltransferase involved in cell wall biosynthesis
MVSRKNPAKILFFVTEDWFFCSHFIDRAVAARQVGYDVGVITRVQSHGDVIRSAGLRLIPLDLSRRGKNFLRELDVIRRLVRIYRTERPDIVHQFALKPILYGTIAARLAGVRMIVNAPVGMGYVFSSRKWKARLIRPLVILSYRWLMNPPRSLVVLENPDDERLLIGLRITNAQHTRLIRGAGVDLQRFAVSPESEGGVLVVLAARMLWDKGVGEYVEAAQLLRSAGVSARFVLVGNTDTANPAAIPESQLLTWQAEGLVEWWGHRDDMPEVLSQAHIVCLPSYREGLPKVLIEAAAAGRSIVATDVPGCREVVRHGENGLLVPARDFRGLAEALKHLIHDSALRRRMGKRGREIAEAEFSVEKIVNETLTLYRSLLA